MLDWLRGTAFPAPPSALYLSLHSDTEATTGAEVSAALGGRVPIDQDKLSSTSYLDGQSSGARQIVNTVAFISDLATEQAEVQSFAIWDAPTGGNRLLFGAVSPAASVLEGDPAIFLQGDLSLRID